MHTSSFARILNAKPLLLTPEKRVMHFPKTNKVRIDNLTDNYAYKDIIQNASRKEYRLADIASQRTPIVPPVGNYRERGNMLTYTQDYAGNPIKMGSMSAKEQYKLGSQVGRQQNRLVKDSGLGHTDIHQGNIVKINPNRREVKLIDNASIEPINDSDDQAMLKYLTHRKQLGKPFMTGYNSRINFTQNKQMQHFANFALPTGFADTLAKAAQNNNPFKNPHAYGTGIKDLYKNSTAGAAVAGGSVGSYLGGAAGIARGMGIGETEEEKANTTALGRVGKVLGGYAGGALAGGAVGAGVGASSRYLRGRGTKPQAPSFN